MESRSPQASVPALQASLAAIEARYEPLRQARKTSGAEWDAISRDAAAVRQELFVLTGDHYGKPRQKKVRPDDALLLASYDSPQDVPAEVRRWIQQNASILTSDATDAVRWGRIVDTLDDERYPDGELTIYRAVAEGDEIRAGDWVTTQRSYAQEHLRRHLNGKGVVLQACVDGRDVLVSPTGDEQEAIFAPRELSGPLEQEPTARQVPRP